MLDAPPPPEKEANIELQNDQTNLLILTTFRENLRGLSTNELQILYSDLLNIQEHLIEFELRSPENTEDPEIKRQQELTKSKLAMVWLKIHDLSQAKKPSG